MNIWPFPVIRNYPTSAVVDGIFQRVFRCDDLQIQRCSLAPKYFVVATSEAGSLRFWNANHFYAWAAEGSFVPSDNSDEIRWKEVMPSRWTVRKFSKIVERAVLEQRVWRVPRVSSKVGATP